MSLSSVIPNEGTRGRYKRFVRDAYPSLTRLGALLVGDRPGGEDLAQTALMKVYAAWPRIEDKEAAPAYTRKVMVRQAARWRRRRWSGERPTELGANDLQALDRTDHIALADPFGAP